MKKLFTLIMAVAIAMPTFAQFGYSRTKKSRFNHNNVEQYYGLRLGYNIASINSNDATIDMNSYGGFAFGGVYGLQLANSTPIWLEAGLFYSEKGGKDENKLTVVNNNGVLTEMTQKVTTRLMYLQAPIVIKYAFDVADDFYVQPFLGGYLAVHIDAFMNFMKKHALGITTFFWVSFAALMGYYYKLIDKTGYTPLEAINTAHQLCPAGIFYTIAASLFFFMVFTYQSYPGFLNPLLHQLGKHSYFAYLAHPLAITYLSMMLQHSGRIMTAPIAIAFYFATLILAMLGAILCRKLGEKLPLINELTIGVYPKKK